MEYVTMNNPKDEHILNRDDSITNKDGNNYLEKGGQPTNQKEPDKERVSTVTPDNDTGEPGSPPEEKPSKKDTESRKYAL